MTILDPDRLDQGYAYFLFVSDVVRSQLRGSATGSTVRHTAPTRIYSAKVQLPPLTTQRKIVGILSAYDDLIDNNNRRIKLLEEMAQRIYHEWFVDLRYPGHENVPLVDSESGPIPEGWSLAHLSTLAAVVMGQSPPSSAYNEASAGLPFHQGAGSYGAHFRVHEVYSVAGDRLAENGDILMSVRAPVGRINLADRQMILGRGLSGIRSLAAPREFLLHALKYFFREEDVMGHGSIFNSATRSDVENLLLVWPGAVLGHRFSELVKPVWRDVQTLTTGTAILRATRDLLLPRLMSGEVDVTDLNIATPQAAA